MKHLVTAFEMLVGTNNLSLILVNSDSISRNQIAYNMLHWMCSTLLTSFSHALSRFPWFFLSVATKKHIWQLDFWTFSSGLDLYHFLVTKPYCREEVAQTSMWKLLITDRIRVKSPIKSACHLSSRYFFLPWFSCSLKNPLSLHLFALWARFNISNEFKKLERKLSKERMMSISSPAGPNMKGCSM